MNKKSLISVIIPTYKRRKDMIQRSLMSVLNQTYENLEVIVVDDSPSTYEYRDEIKNYIDRLNDHRVNYIQHDQNKGANVARNTGILNSRGEFIAFLDDDDEWLVDKLEKQVKLFKKNSKLGLVYCKAEVVSNNNQKTESINEMKSGYQFQTLLKQNFIGSNSYVLIKKSVIDEVGMYDQNLLSNQDYDLFLRIAKDYQINFVDEPLVRYFIHDGERISTNPQKIIQGRNALETKYSKYIQENSEIKTIWKIKSIPLNYRAGNKSKAFTTLLEVLTREPIFLFQYLSGTLQRIRKRNRKL